MYELLRGSDEKLCGTNNKALVKRTVMQSLKIVAVVGAAMLMWGLLFAYASSPAQAATLTVNSLSDTTANDGQCTLREAIFNANANDQSGSTDCAAGSGSDTLRIGVAGTVQLSGRAAEPFERHLDRGTRGGSVHGQEEHRGRLSHFHRY